MRELLRDSTGRVRTNCLGAGPTAVTPGGGAARCGERNAVSESSPAAIPTPHCTA